MTTSGTLRRMGAIIALSAAAFLNGCAVSGRFGPGGEQPDLIRASVSIGREAEPEASREEIEHLKTLFAPLGKDIEAKPSIPVLQNEVRQDRQNLGALEQNIDRLAESVVPTIIQAERELDSFGSSEVKQEVRSILRSTNLQDFLKKARTLSPEAKALAVLALIGCLIILVRSRRARERAEQAARLLPLQRQLEALQLQTSSALAATMQQARHLVQESQAHFAAMNSKFAERLERVLTESRARETRFEEALHDINALLVIARPTNAEQASRLARAIAVRILQARERM